MRLLIFKYLLMFALGCLFAEDTQYLWAKDCVSIEFCESEENKKGEDDSKEEKKENEEKLTEKWWLERRSFEFPTAEFAKQAAHLFQITFFQSPVMAIFSPPPELV